MATKRGRKPTGKACSTRATVSFAPDIYQTLQDIAKQKKVSVAWVVREAAEQYVASQWPLFSAANGGRQRHG